MDTLNLQLHIEWSLWKWTWRLDEKKVKVSVTQFCPTVWQYMDCSSPGSSVHGILQARILEWVATSYSRGSSPNLRDRTQVLCFTGRFSTTWATAFTSNKNNLQMKSRRTLIWGAVEETVLSKGNIPAMVIHNWEGSQRYFFTPFPYVLYFWWHVLHF